MTNVVAKRFGAVLFEDNTNLSRAPQSREHIPLGHKHPKAFVAVCDTPNAGESTAQLVRVEITRIQTGKDRVKTSIMLP